MWDYIMAVEEVHDCMYYILVHVIGHIILCGVSPSSHSAGMVLLLD